MKRLTLVVVIVFLLATPTAVKSEQPGQKSIIPFQDFQTRSWADGEDYARRITNDIIVPAGKLLIIEHVSARGCLPRGQRPRLSIRTIHLDGPLGHEIPMWFEGVFPFEQGRQPVVLNCWTGSLRMQLYAIPVDNTVTLQAYRTDGDPIPGAPGVGFVSLKVSGRLVDWSP